MSSLNVALLCPSIDCSMVLWLNLSTGKVGERGIESHSGIKFSKSRTFFPPHSRKFYIVGNLRDRGVASSALDRRAQITNPVSRGQCHLIHLKIIRKFSGPGLAYMCIEVA